MSEHLPTPKAEEAKDRLGFAVSLAVLIPFGIGRLATVVGWGGMHPGNYAETLRGFALTPEVAWGEPWRLLTAIFVHKPMFAMTDAFHVLAVAVAFYFAGPEIERVLGLRRATASLAASGLLATAIAFAVAPYPGAAGGLGAVMALVGMAFGALAAQRLTGKTFARLLAETLIPVAAFLALGTPSDWDGLYFSPEGMAAGALSGTFLAWAFLSGRSKLAWAAVVAGGVLALGLVGGRAIEVRGLFVAKPATFEAHSRIYFSEPWKQAESALAERRQILAKGGHRLDLEPANGRFLTALDSLVAAGRQYPAAVADRDELWRTAGAAAADSVYSDLRESIKAVNAAASLDLDLWNHVYGEMLKFLGMEGADLAVGRLRWKNFAALYAAVKAKAAPALGATEAVRALERRHLLSEP